jgi:hypothetical protein
MIVAKLTESIPGRAGDFPLRGKAMVYELVDGHLVATGREIEVVNLSIFPVSVHHSIRAEAWRGEYVIVGVDD